MPVNQWGQNLLHILGNNALHHHGHNIGHQEEFIELNDFNNHQLDALDFEKLQEMLNPEVQNAPMEGIDGIDLNQPIAESDSELAVTFSFDVGGSSSDSVQNVAPPMPHDNLNLVDVQVQ